VGMVFVLDNYDSFTYNLVQYMGELGAEVVVRRNDELTPEEIVALKPERILLSPGPCTPQEAGILVPLLKHLASLPMKQQIPTLGVCLGHQAIGAAFGGEVIRAEKLMDDFCGAAEADDLHAIPLADCARGECAGGAGGVGAGGGREHHYGAAA